MTDAVPPGSVVVALVPAKDRAEDIGATVAALRGLDAVDRVLVVDDGSGDETTAAARAAGAEVLRLSTNRGKGGAVLAGVEATPDADVYVLIDADLAATASAAHLLLDPVLAGEADMTIGVFPPAEGRGGAGRVKALARWSIRRATGREVVEPLSGQRAVRRELLAGLPSADRFGLEVALTIDALRSGARVVEVEVPMDHRHTGGSWHGVVHRARQGADIARALWPRLIPSGARIAAVAALLVLAVAVTYLTARATAIDSQPLTDEAGSVVVFGIPRLGLDDVGNGRTPNLDRLIADGAMASMTVRTAGGSPTTLEAYSTLSAGARVLDLASAAEALPSGARFEGSTAAEAAERRSGLPVDGTIVVPTGAAARRLSGKDVSSRPGALAAALHDADLTAVVVGNADTRNDAGEGIVNRPAAVAVMDPAGSVDGGTIGSGLLQDDPGAPFGVAVRPEAFVAEAQEAMAEADLSVLDAGEMDRVYAYSPVVGADQYERLRLEALERTDAILGEIAASLPDDALLLVLGMTPPTGRWELTPAVAYGAGVEPGRLASRSTNRDGLVTLTDVPTTVLDVLGAERPEGMIGRPLEHRAGAPDLSALEQVNEVATGRERIYYPMALTFIIVQALAYVFAVFAFASTDPTRRLAATLRFLVLSFAAWPLATFLVRIVPAAMTWGTGTHLLTWVVAAGAALLAGKARGHPLAPLSVITTATVVLLVADVALGARLQTSSILGYSPHTAARFTGLGNTAYAVLAASALLTAVILCARRGSSRPAVAAAAALLALIIVVDGAPWLGSDVGGILSLVPVYGLVVVALSGRRLTFRALLLAGVATAVVLALATGIDLLRPAGSRTHLGTFVSDSLRDSGTFTTTVSRKWATNVRVFQQSIWTWMVPIVACFSLYVLVVAKGWSRLLPRGSRYRLGVVSALGLGLLGWLVNDSGVVVTALVFVYVGPFLTLLALDGRYPGPELLPAEIPTEETAP
ncbi:MAG TPA: glycosyltransferase [Iamia sp.]|nr:glycosyltransferase [Iamia sp.]